MNAIRSLFPNAAIIARREYLVRVRGRTFFFSTLFMAVVGLALTLAPVVINAIASGSQTKIAVYSTVADLPSDTMASLDQALFGASGSASTSPSGQSGTRQEFVLTRVSDLATAERDVRDGKFNGLLVICRATSTGAVPAPCDEPAAAVPAAVQPADLVFQYRADVPSNGRQAYFVRQAATHLALEDRLARANVNAGQLFGSAAFALVSPKTSSGAAASPTTPQSDTDEVSKVLLATGLIVLILISVVGYGNWVAVSVAEEKSSRVMEIMLSSATPIQMLAGKVMGNGGAGLVQYLAILAAGAVGLLLQDPLSQALGQGTSNGGLPVAGLSIAVLLAFGLFFVLGFVLYALLYAAAGSMVSRQEDVQQAAMPLMIISMVGYFAATIAVNAPDESWVQVASYVPFFSPYLMLARLVVGQVAPWELGLSVALLVVTILAALWIAARIYSAGVLMYGQRAGLRQILAAARVAR